MLRSLYKEALWRMDKKKPEIYLTFDDGPIPEMTPWVLDVLRDYGVKATFFCVGDNIRKHPTVFGKLLAHGHQLGNHTYNHLKGWKTNTAEYLRNVAQCQELTNTHLFRPPYGRLKPSQYKVLKQQYTLAFWDVLSYDYDHFTSPENCLRNVTRYTREGSIVLFHDSIKASQNLKYALPKYLEHCLNLNYTFATL